MPLDDAARGCTYGLIYSAVGWVVVLVVAVLILAGCADAPAPVPEASDVTTNMPLVVHTFYDRPTLMTYCMDHRMIFLPRYGRTATACARSYAHYCAVAIPYNWHGDRRTVFAVCNSWSPRL